MADGCTDRMTMTVRHAPAAARTLNDWQVGRVLEWVRAPGNGAGDTLDHRTSEAISRVAQVDASDRGRLITAVLDAAAEAVDHGWSG